MCDEDESRGHRVIENLGVRRSRETGLLGSGNVNAVAPQLCYDDLVQVLIGEKASFPEPHTTVFDRTAGASIWRAAYSTACSMASVVSAGHPSRIRSTVAPLARSSRIWETLIRVSLMQGLPPNRSGLATMSGKSRESCTSFTGTS